MCAYYSVESIGKFISYIILPITGITEFNFDILESVRQRASDLISMLIFHARESSISTWDEVSVRHICFLFQVTSWDNTVTTDYFRSLYLFQYM